MSWLKALFLPIVPPKNFSIAEINFEIEYKEMKEQYLKRQQRNDNSDAEARFSMPLAWTLR